MKMIVPCKIELANLPTPVQQIYFSGCRFKIKRDDYTGTELSGNKIRKLEYLLYDAKKKAADYVFTCGGDQSNHARATVLAAARLGLKSRLFLWGKDKKTLTGNELIDKMAGAELVYLSRKEYNDVNALMENEAEKLKRIGRKVYIIPTGGSTPIGIWGYINFVDELIKQVDISKVKGICCANGSGGTVAGIMLGASLRNLNVKVFGVNVVGTKGEMNGIIEQLIEDCRGKYKITNRVNFDNLELLDGYSEEGYKHIAPNKADLIKNFAASTGIILDPTYTGKAFYAYNQNFISGKKSSSVIFLHTGGIFGIFPKADKFVNNN